MRLLIAEDDAGAGEALTTAFSDEGYEVEWARSGDEARAAFRKGGWDCVLTDIVMPDVDGLVLLKEFVAVKEAPPVIVMTAYGSIERAVQAVKDGAYDFLEKPLDLGQLRALVATASLELGIDVGVVDLVCLIGSPRSIGVALQRIGRSGHWLGGTPKGRLFPLTRDELVETAALLQGAGYPVSFEGVAG